MLCSITLTVSMIGCGEYTPGEDPSELVTLEADTDEFVEWWAVVSINGKALKKTFDDYSVGDNNVFFSYTGAFKREVTFYIVETDAWDPETFMSGRITYTTRGRYTTRGKRLTLTTLSRQVDVDARDVHLEPEAVWQQQTQGMTLEALRSAKAAEIKKGFQQAIPPPLFKDDTEYTWQIEGGQLTLSSPQQTIVLWRGFLRRIGNRLNLYGQLYT